VIALQGHSPAQAPQSMHSSAFTFAVPSTVIALTGQVAAHTPQPEQADSSTFAAMVHFSLPKMKDPVPPAYPTASLI